MARPQMDHGAVGGAIAAGIQTQPRLHAGDGAIGVDVPLLIGLAIAVPDDDSGAVGSALPIGVQALVAIHGQLPAGGVRPSLVAAAVAIPQLHLSAVGGTGSGHVSA